VDNKAKGICLAFGPVVAFVGWVLCQVTFVGSADLDDIGAILANSAGETAIATVAIILIGLGLPLYLAGLRGIKGQASGAWETLGILFITIGSIVFIANLGILGSLVTMADKLVTYMAAAGSATDTAEAAKYANAAAATQLAAGAVQAINVTVGSLGTLLFSVGFTCLGIAYLSSDFKGILPFIPLSYLALIAGILGIVAVIIITPTVNPEFASMLSGITFLIGTIWAVLVGAKLAITDG